MNYFRHCKLFSPNIFFLIAVFIFGIFQTAQGESWKPENALLVNSIPDVGVSPDGEEVVYTVTEAKLDDETNAYISHVWKGKIDDLSSHAQLVQDTSPSFYPRWSPDGHWIAFLSNKTGEKNLYIISKEGGDPIQLTNMNNGIETFRWSPDGNMIAFIAKTEPIVDPSISNLAKNQKIPQLFVIKAEPTTDQPKLVTSHEYCVVGEIDFGTLLEAFDWSPDNTKIAFTYTPEIGQDSRWKNSQIAIVDLKTQTIEHLPMLVPHQSIPRFSPDGKLLAFLKSDPHATYSLTRHITLYSFVTGQFTALQKTPDEGPFLVGPSLLGWTSDSSSLFYLEPYRTKFALWNIPIDGRDMIRIDNGNWTFKNPILSSNGKWIGLTLETLDTPPEAYITSSSDFSPKKASNVNAHLKKWNMPETKTIRWNSLDGQEIEGLVTFPKGYSAQMHYPLLLVIHGGPMGVFSETYLGANRFYPLAAFADAGFVILRVNPRGSCGYGHAFRHATYCDWGGKDYLDLMSGVDTLIHQEIVDPNRLGVMGWSYGGYMTAWIISQTNRFSAASMGAGLSNLLSFTGTTDLHHFFSDYFGGEIWENPTLYLERSPIFYTHQVSTPLLIQHGQDDPRVPFSQSIEFYRALQKLNKPVRLEAYPQTPHHILEPQLNLNALETNFQWFLEHMNLSQ